MAIDWSTPVYASCFPYRQETRKVLPLEEYVQVVHEHERSIEQVFPIVPITTCDPFVTVVSARQALRVFRGEADPEVDK